ncbi:RE2 [Symbiodinium sp. CCMP2592]|nr:RE2 [Symbiodinium sp. CCMP2592]
MTDIPEPRTPEQAPPGAGQEIQSPSSESSLDTAPVPKVGPAPGEDTPDFGGTRQKKKGLEGWAGQAAPASGPTEATPEAEPKALPKGAPAAKANGREAPEQEQKPTSSPADEGEEEESEESSEGQGLAEQYGEALTLLDEISQAIFASGGGHLLKSMRLPTSLKGRDDWERFAFQAETYLAVVDTRYPAELEIARKRKVPLQMAAMTEEVRTLSVRLFGMLGSWTQDSATAVKLAHGVKGQNGFELWRLLRQEHNPENESKNLTWRRTLLMPKFPPKESDFSLALQEWEADVDRYASEYGAGRALADEDLRAVLVTESPNALRQHLAMHAASLSTYAEVREVVVSYLQAKRVWTPSAGYAASSRRDPNAMDIGRIGDRDGKEGKGKGDKGKKGDKDHKKGKGDHDHKGKKGDKKGNQQGGRDGKERCPICWKTGHTVKECWFNAKGKGKGNKSQVAQVADDAATTLSTASLATAGPSASQAGGSTGGSGGKGQVRQVRDDRILGVRFAPPHDTEPEEEKPEAFPDLQPAGPPKSLYSVDNSRCGIWLHREDSHILWPDGVRQQTGWHRWRQSHRADLGHYDYIPEHDLEAREVEDAAMEAAADEEAEAAEEENVVREVRAEGKAREDPHRRREPSDDPVTPLVTMDYQFYSRDGKEVEEEASLATVLNLTDRATGWTLSVPVAHKGHRHAAYAAGLVEQFVDRLGHVAWLQARFGTKSTDGVTHRAATGTDYGGALCSFGETVLAKLPRPGNKAQVSWVKGVWAGKLERDDSHVVLTEAGALNVRRSVRRLPPETRHQTAAVLKACGLPWNPRFGRSAPAERSEPMMVPIPLATPAEEVERLEPPGEPWLFSDGPRPDDEALLVGGRAGQQAPGRQPYRGAGNADIPDYEPSDVEAAPSAASAAATSGKPQPPTTAQAKGGRSVTDLLDRMLDPKQVEQARKEQLRKLWDRGTSQGVPVKARYSPEQEAGLDVFVPTPTPESHSLLEVAALHNEGWVTRSLDIVAAFLIGKDRGAAEGRPVYMYAPVEWRELFDQWVLEQPAKDQQWYRDHFRDFVFRVDGNLYGRRTAGSVYRDELEEVLAGKLAKDYDFQRGVKDPCVYLDRRSGLILLHHIDDIRVAGPKAAVLKFTEVDLPTHCEITVGELEEPGTAVEVLGRTKVRTEDSILTLPDSKHAENVRVEELSAGDAARFRSAVGSAIYLSADRRDIQFAVKELARRMQNPRVCDWLAAETLARYLRATPRFGRVVVLDPASKSTALLNLEVYSDSDWAGCPETRRSTDNIVACLGGAVIQTSCQTQPGLPATSSGDAEIRGVSRAAREAVFLRELAEKDFALACGLPRLWADSAASIGAAKRIGPGSKLRHLEVAEFFVQGALRAKLLELRKVKGTENPANFATKHAKTGPEVRQSLPSMGMVDLDAVAGATEALAQKGTIKSIQASPWKMRPPTKLTSSALMATIVALQVRPAKAQGHDFAELVLGFAAFGFLAFLWMLWSLVSWLCRRRPERQEPEPEDEIEHHAEACRRAAACSPKGHGGPPPAAAPPPPPPAAPRVRRRRRGPEPLSGDDEHLYETARGDKIHLFTNCNGLSSVPADQILIGFRCHCAADPQNTEFLWTGFAFQVATGRVVRRYHGQQRGCPFMQGATIRHRVCLHCRNGHQSTKPGSAVNNSRHWEHPPRGP